MNHEDEALVTRLREVAEKLGPMGDDVRAAADKLEAWSELDEWSAASPDNDYLRLGGKLRALGSDGKVYEADGPVELARAIGLMS